MSEDTGGRTGADTDVEKEFDRKLEHLQAQKKKQEEEKKSDPNAGLKWIFRKLQKYSNRWWYLPLMAVLVFLDLFVGFIPSEGLLVKSVLLKPRRWLYAPLLLITASALGAVALGHLTFLYGEEFVRWVDPAILEKNAWQRTESFLASYGAVALAVIAFSPLPQQPAIVLCGLAGMNPMTIFLAVWLGRAPKYYLFAWLAKQSPKFFKKYFTSTYEELKSL